MNYYVYVDNILGIKTNIDRFRWVYGSVAPQTSESDFNKCKIKINLYVRKSEDVFDKTINQYDYDKYNYFFGHKNEKKIYYERDFFFNTKLRYSVEIKKNNNIDVIVSKNYFKYIKYKFMNLHSIGYIMTDLIVGLLLNNGYSTIHCSAINFKNKTLVIFAPPSTGKTITAIKLCDNKGVRFIAEDIALTDGEKIYAAPWTSTFRYYNHHKESKWDKFVDLLRNKIPVLQLVSIKERKSIDMYLGKDCFLNKSKITDIVVLGKGNNEVLKSKNSILEKLINLNKYEFNYHRSPTMLVMNYFNPELSIDKMFESEKVILNQLISNSNGCIINSNNALDYSKQIIEKVL